jgi:hypothetical protein
MLLALENQHSFWHNALLDVNWSHLGCGSVGSAFRTGTTQVAAPQLHPSFGCHPRDNGAAHVRN